MDTTTKPKQLEAKPLFAYALDSKIFLIIYIVGFLAMFSWLHMNIQINDSPNIISTQISILIYAFLAPSVLILAKKIFNEFNCLFKKPSKPQDPAEMPITKSEEFANLFSKPSVFQKYRSEICQTVNSSKQKIISIILGFIFLPLNLWQDLQIEFYSSMFATFPFSIQAVEYLCYYLFWITLYALLFSIILLILSVTYALLRLSKEKTHLQITEKINGLNKKFKEIKKNKILKSDIEQLNASFNTFSSSLSIISDFILSLSLKIAFVGGFSTIPAVIYFLTTGRIATIWYGACIVACSLSIIVFILGQYGAWSVWSETKSKATKTLGAIRAKYPEICSNGREDDTEHIDIYCINKTQSDIEKTKPVTYTSSAMFKIASANFLAFGPIIIEQVVTRLILK